MGPLPCLLPLSKPLFGYLAADFLGVEMASMTDGRAKLSLHPMSERKVTLYGTAGYESTWGGHFAVDARIAPLASAGQSLDFQGSTNRFQDWARLEFRQALPFFSRVGFSVL